MIIPFLQGPNTFAVKYKCYSVYVVHCKYNHISCNLYTYHNRETIYKTTSITECKALNTSINQTHEAGLFNFHDINNNTITLYRLLPIISLDRANKQSIYLFL